MPIETAMPTEPRDFAVAPPGPVFVTGATGFIAKHVVLQLLNAGYSVIGSVRDASWADEVRAALSPHLVSTAGLEDRLRFVSLDLNLDEGWVEAMAGAGALVHTASPYPPAMPADENELIHPAVEGTLRALRAAKACGIARVVMTSSSVAIVYCHTRPGRDAHDEDDWSDLSLPFATAYVKSKTLAERAAWRFVVEEAPDMKLTAINPVLVLGRPLDDRYGTSVAIIERLLRGRDPLLPDIGVGVVDVEDVAAMHVAALENDASAGMRFLAVDRYMRFRELCRILKGAYPARRISTTVAPHFVVRLIALFDGQVRSILPLLGRDERFDASQARRVLGMEFRPAEQSILASADYIVSRGIA